jgi:two-component system CheB/CheR fusion protein
LKRSALFSRRRLRMESSSGEAGGGGKTVRSDLKERAGPARPRRGPARPGTEPVAARFSLVGIGASAGGLEAFSQLLALLPVNTGMAFVLIQHLDPSHPSLLPSALARITSMDVSEVTIGMRIAPNHVYVIPANADLALHNRVFTLVPREE